MATPWARAIAEAAEDEPDTLDDAVHRELELLWADLGDAMRNACNGSWSIGCDNLVTRIVQLSRAAGTWVPWKKISYPLLLDGTWQGITAAAGITVPAPGEEDVARARKWAAAQRAASQSAG